MGRLLSIVLVTWNSASTLPRCLTGILQQSWPDLELVVVDNASLDESARLVRRAAPKAQLIQNATNRGFAPAVNQALGAACGELVLLVNPDAFLERDYARRLIEALDAAGQDFGMATGKLLRGEGDAITPAAGVDTKGIRMTRSGRHLDIGQGSADGADDRGLRPLGDSGAFEVFGVSGAAALYRRRFLDDAAIDGEVFDEDFFAYREDADLSWRGRIFGWRALYVPAAVGYHVRRVTPERRRSLPPELNMHSVKNRFLLRLKNESWYLALRNAPFELARDAIALAAVLTIERSSLPALTWLWQNRSRIAAKRRAIQRRRRVSDRAIASWFA